MGAIARARACTRATDGPLRVDERSFYRKYALSGNWNVIGRNWSNLKRLIRIQRKNPGASIGRSMIRSRRSIRILENVFRIMFITSSVAFPSLVIADYLEKCFTLQRRPYESCALGVSADANYFLRSVCNT